MAVHPLRPATDRRLGGPLPHQLANQTRVHLIPPECFHTVSCDTVRLCGFTSRFQLLSPCMRQVTHALLTRPPLSHKRLQTEVICLKCFVRLACVKHAASVYPEPGSNSHVQFSVQFCANAFLSVCVSYLKDFTVFIGCSLYYAKNFTRLTAFAIWLFKKSSGLVILFNYQGSL